jgi:hypothetical protein
MSAALTSTPIHSSGNESYRSEIKSSARCECAIVEQNGAANSADAKRADSRRFPASNRVAPHFASLAAAHAPRAHPQRPNARSRDSASGGSDAHPAVSIVL